MIARGMPMPEAKRFVSQAAMGGLATWQRKTLARPKRVEFKRQMRPLIWNL